MLGSYDAEKKLYRPAAEPARRFMNRLLTTIAGDLSLREATCFACINDIQRADKIAGDLVEFGVGKGRSALMLAFMASGQEMVIGFDHFDLPGAQDPRFNDPAQFEHNLGQVDVREKVQTVKLDTVEGRERVLGELTGRNIRFIHLDAGRSYEAVRNDIGIAFDVVSDKGVIVCDDFFTLKQPDVTRAVLDELKVRRKAFSPFLVTGQKLWIAPARVAPRYTARLTQIFGPPTNNPRFAGTRMRYDLPL